VLIIEKSQILSSAILESTGSEKSLHSARKHPQVALGKYTPSEMQPWFQFDLGGVDRFLHLNYLILSHTSSGVGGERVGGSGVGGAGPSLWEQCR